MKFPDRKCVSPSLHKYVLSWCIPVDVDSEVPSNREEKVLAARCLHPLPIAALNNPHKCGSLRQHDSVIWWCSSSRTEMGLWLLKSRYWRGSGVQPLPRLSEQLRFYSLACIPSSNSGAAIFSCLCAAFCRLFLKLKWLNVCMCVCASVCHMCEGIRRSEEGVASPGARVTCRHELADLGAGNGTLVLQKSNLALYCWAVCSAHFLTL